MDEAQTPERLAAEMLEQLVFECLERIEAGGLAAADAVIAAHAEHAAALRARLEALERAGLLASAGASSEESFPERLGEFRLLRKLGGGGMGVVYLAEQVSLGRRVALKLIRPEHVYFPGARERFRREVEAVARLAHPSIVPVFTVGEENGLPYFAMEHVEGSSLAEILHALAGRAPASLTGRSLREAIVRRASEQCPGDASDSSSSSFDARMFSGSWVESCLRIARQIAEALEHAHLRGVLHRDVKPSNVIVTPGGRACLLDFGLAALHGTHSITRSGSQLGSKPYMPPELLESGAKELDARGDVYALGVTLYELLALRAPYEASDALALEARILEGHPEPIRRLNPAVQPDAETVCLRAMERDAARRYASAADFARDLSNVLELRPIEARRASAWLRGRRWAQRHPGWSAALSLGSILLVGGPLGFALQQRAANREIRAERDVADGQRKLAEANFEKALAAIDLLTRTGQDRLLGVPQAEEARRELLEGALGFYEGFLAQKNHAPGLAFETAMALRRVGEIYGYLGRLADSETRMREAIARIETLPPPMQARAQRDLAVAYRRLGETQKLQGAIPEAEVSTRRAVEILESVVKRGNATEQDRFQLGANWIQQGDVSLRMGKAEAADGAFVAARDAFDTIARENPRNEAARLNLAYALERLGTVRSKPASAEDARACYQRSIELLEALVAQHPNAMVYREKLAPTYSNLANLLVHMERGAQAAPLLEKAISMGTALVSEFPKVPKLREDLATGYLGLAMVRNMAGDLDAGRAALDRSVEILEPLVAEHPEVPDYRTKLAGALINLSANLIARKRFEEACASIEKANALARKSLEMNPNDPDTHRTLEFLALNLGEALVGRGLHAEAAAAVRELPYPDTAREFTSAASIGSRCVRLAREDSALSESERETAVRAYTEQSLGHLRKAIERGFKKVSTLRSDESLESIRSDPAFQQLCQELEAKALATPASASRPR